MSQARIKYAVQNVNKMDQQKVLVIIVITLSPISETNINVNAAVNPDFAIAARTDEGPPFTKAISENTSAHPNSTKAIERG